MTKRPRKRSKDAGTNSEVGRKPAKHSNPEYVQMSCYIERDVRKRVKMRLLETDGEFSALVEALLRDWLKGGA